MSQVTLLPEQPVLDDRDDDDDEDDGDGSDDDGDDDDDDKRLVRQESLGSRQIIMYIEHF